jgi:hypothetical protein
MDNKNDRKFYWEVKDFMTSRNTHNPIPIYTPKPSIADQAKIILEKKQNLPSKPLEVNNTIMNAACQVIGRHQKQEAGYDPKSQAFSKNSDVNSFRGMNEGYWEDFKSGLDALFTNRKTYEPTPILTQQQASMNALLNKASSENKLTADQLSLERLASGKPLTSSELLQRIAAQNVKPGVPLTPEQKRERDLAGELKREEGLEQMAQDDVEAEEAGSKIVRTSDGREYGLKPSTLPTSTSPSPASTALGKPETPGSDTGEPPSFGGDVSDKTKGLLASMDAKKASTSSPTPTDKSAEQRAARKAEANQKRKEQAERSLAYFEALHDAKAKQGKGERPEHTAQRVAHMKRLQQKIQGLG